MDMRDRMRRPAPASKTVQQTVTTEAKPAHQTPLPSVPKASSVKRADKKKPRWPLILGGFLIVCVIAVGLFFARQFTGVSAQIKNGQYQAVFLTNGEIYFGRLALIGNSEYKLSDVYYLQRKSTTATDAEASNQLESTNTDTELIKLGNEVHGPEDKMIIGRDQVLFFENLKNDGKVVKAIEQHKKN